MSPQQENEKKNKMSSDMRVRPVPDFIISLYDLL